MTRPYNLKASSFGSNNNTSVEEPIALRPLLSLLSYELIVADWRLQGYRLISSTLALQDEQFLESFS